MPVGWILVKPHDTPEGRANFANVHNLKNLALQDGKPWAQAVHFTVHTPLAVFWCAPPKTPRKWEAAVEVDRVSKADLGDIFQFVEQKCSHVDALG